MDSLMDAWRVAELNGWTPELLAGKTRFCVDVIDRHVKDGEIEN